jgi:RNA polymerase sigma-70 factor, ECF subfamily
MQIDHALPDVVSWETGSKSNSDRVLLASIALGDASAMRVLFARHKVRIYRFAMSLIDNEAAAEDIVSEVFLEVWRHAGKFEGRSEVSTWLLAIARNLAWSTLRQRSTQGLDSPEVDFFVDPADGSEIAMGKRQESSIIAYCLKQLSPAHREVIDLVYYHGMSINEVSVITGIPQNTVKTRMFYARNQMAQLLRRFVPDRVRPTATAVGRKSHPLLLKGVSARGFRLH